MSIDATRWAWQIQNIKATAKIVLLSLADRAGEQHECWPSLDRLVLDTCLDRHTVCRALVALEQEGFIEKRKRFGSSTLYRLIGVPDRVPSSAQIPTSGEIPTPVVRKSPLPVVRKSPLEPINESTNEPSKSGQRKKSTRETSLADDLNDRSWARGGGA